MREARSYSIVDHALLHGGHLGRLSHAAMALYLFLVVVGNREGRSFYSDASVGALLRLAVADARSELLRAGLIRYRHPFWWVEGLTRAAPKAVLLHPSHGNACGHRDERPSRPAPLPVRGAVPEALRALIRTLEGKP